MGTLVGRPGIGLGRAGGRGPVHHFFMSYNGRPRPDPGPLNLWWAAARPGPANFQRMDRGPPRPIKRPEDGPRPGSAHHIFKNTRPGPTLLVIFY